MVQRLKSLQENLLGGRPVYRALMTQRTDPAQHRAECVNAAGVLTIATRMNRQTENAMPARGNLCAITVLGCGRVTPMKPSVAIDWERHDAPVQPNPVELFG